MLSGGKVSLRGGAAEGAAADLGLADLSLSGSSSWPRPSPPLPGDLAHPRRALPYLDLQGATKDSGLAPASFGGGGAGLEERWSEG